ncbi:MAG TPA: cobalamin-binding protein [Povalibacter sp.]|uniref:cobalamin-binding protein n=1 Tax=Povalibacter sp. TaxID=1962978 RepID=UPI002CDC0586|nr:cobalamin-binding protein [Povalibacter sp.]HMN46043.1 cobalamin-binding protein [Povalibacter sp.]
MKKLLLLCALAHLTTPAVAASRIVSLAPNLTELAFVAGAGDKVIGTAEYSDYPERAKAIPRIGDAFRVDYERILALQPDAVLAWEPGTPHATVERLRTLRLAVSTIRTRSLADIGTAVRDIGAIAGTPQIAGREADRFERAIASLREEYSARTPVTVFLQINDQPLYTVNGTQIMSEVLALCGGVNVFGDLNELAPQVGVEAVIAANPEVIISTGAADAPAFVQWRRWPQIRAVGAGNLYAMSPDNLARSTTRLATGAADLCRTLQTARERLRRPN